MIATDTTVSTLLVAIDISKLRLKVQIGVPGKKRRRRLTITDTLDDFRRLAAFLMDYGLPVRIGFEPTGNLSSASSSSPQYKSGCGFMSRCPRRVQRPSRPWCDRGSERVRPKREAAFFGSGQTQRASNGPFAILVTAIKRPFSDGCKAMSPRARVSALRYT